MGAPRCCTADGRGNENDPHVEEMKERSSGESDHHKGVKNEGSSGDVYESKCQGAI